ncbi:MAG: alpha/beta fold hydrolase [Bacteroidetes bacterium]|nr:alpha/beta fold hydrolase [Bacteroidota bacterium]MCH8523157.1 alpha/beta fold hydrolase [Balneolales bacterium]
MPNRVVKKHTGSLPSTEGNPIFYDLYVPGNAPDSLPVLLFLHGFKGFKDWGTFPDAFFEMARQDYAVLAMNVSHGGVPPNADTFEHADLFRTQTIGQEIQDIKTVVAAVKSGVISKQAGISNVYPLGIIGHSRGGTTAVLAACEIDEISCLVAWAPVANILDFWSEEMKSTWQQGNDVVITNARTGEELPIGPQLYEEIATNPGMFNALDRIKSLYIPCLFIHAADDETVPHRHSQLLLEACAGFDKEKLLLDKGGHTFGSAHPYTADELPPEFAQVVDQTIRWFQTYMF